MPFAATWMDLEIITLSEVSQTEKDKYHMISPGNPKDKGASQATVHGVAKSWTQLNNTHTHTHTHTCGILKNYTNELT